VLLGLPLGAGNTTIMLTAAKNPVVLGDNIVLTARVSPATATGAVTFYDGSTVKGTVVLSAGTALLTIPNATVGSHALKAVYGGGPGENPSDSAILTEVVITALTPGAPVPNPLTSNVLTNPGAESGMTGWWPGSTASMAVAESPHTGSYSFLGAHVPSAFITQTLQLAQVAGITLTQVDSGNLAANFSFWFTDLSPGSGSHGEITLTFEDANGTILGQGVSSSLRNNTNQTWLNGTGSFPIPPGARIVNYTMDFLTSSSGNTGLMDDNVFTISPVNP
jgi:Bacterial Ig-like domain (group 3)